MESIKKYLLDTYDFKLTKTGKLKLSDNSKINPVKILKDISDFNTVDKYNLQDFHRTVKDKTLEIEKTLDLIQNDMLYSSEKSLVENSAEIFRPENVVLGIDAYKDAIHILNTDFERLPVHVESWKRFFGPDRFAKLERVFCTMRYNPYTLDKVMGDDGLVKIINTCIHPEWRYQDTLKAKELHPLFLKFFEGFFRNTASKKYTCSWIHNSIFNRNETALTMVGVKAAGKNILCSTFPRMVGLMNVSNQANNAYQEKFNGFLKDSRIVVADEVSFRTTSEKNRVKKYFNTIQSVETKGKDSETIEVFCSMVMLSNDVHDLKIESDDRRFSCVDITNTPLPKRMTPKEISELRAYIDHDPDFPLAFYNYIQNNLYENFVNAVPFKGEIYEELIHASLSEFFLAIIQKIKEGVSEGFELGDIDIDWEKFDRRNKDYRYDTLKHFFNTYTIDGEKLGTIVKTNKFKKYYIEVNPKLRAEGFESSL